MTFSVSTSGDFHYAVHVVRVTALEIGKKNLRISVVEADTHAKKIPRDVCRTVSNF
jgi:hypothetical protein